MADVLTKKQRSYNMSRIRSENTTPELVLRKQLCKCGIRSYRLHYKLPGKPDIVFIGKNVAIFIDGCFWHMCPDCFRMPVTRKEFWKKKIRENVNRDRKINAVLTTAGWTVIRLWEHEIKRNPGKSTNKIIRALKNHKSF